MVEVEFKMKIVSVCSGGLDSVAYTSKYLSQENEIHILTFDYGQKGKIEIEAVKEIFKDKVKEIKVVDISFMKELWPNTQLTDSSNKVEDGYQTNVVVPIRNAVFTVIATAYAMGINADRVILGSHINDTTIFEGDYMYPDCDSRFFELLETTLHLGHFKNSKKVEIISASRENLGKQDLIKIGYEILGNDLFKTWSCYNSNIMQCGGCESCNNRKNAFDSAGIKDLTVYAK
jgi:7-cyano-7-deazaguanine synthase